MNATVIDLDRQLFGFTPIISRKCLEPYKVRAQIFVRVAFYDISYDGEPLGLISLVTVKP